MSARRDRQRERRRLAVEGLLPTKPRKPARGVTATRLRRWVDAASHCPPMSMDDHLGGPWLGASRILDRPARRRSERSSWRALQADARREYLCEGSE